MGSDRPSLPLLRHLAADHQHQLDDYTFLMVFVIQNTQNRDGAAIQAKLDELIRVSAARNTLIGIETLTQDEIEEIRATCAAKARRGVNGTVKEANNKAKAAAMKALS